MHLAANSPTTPLRTTPPLNSFVFSNSHTLVSLQFATHSFQTPCTHLTKRRGYTPLRPKTEPLHTRRTRDSYGRSIAAPQLARAQTPAPSVSSSSSSPLSVPQPVAASKNAYTCVTCFCPDFRTGFDQEGSFDERAKFTRLYPVAVSGNNHCGRSLLDGCPLRATPADECRGCSTERGAGSAERHAE